MIAGEPKTRNATWHVSFRILTQAREYFKSLPAKKTPARGTPGERYRQKQLIRQLPAHDIDTFYCNERTEDEKKQLELFIRLRREKFLGRGGIKMRQPDDKSPSWVHEYIHTHA